MLQVACCSCSCIGRTHREQKRKAKATQHKWDTAWTTTTIWNIIINTTIITVIVKREQDNIRDKRERDREMLTVDLGTPQCLVRLRSEIESVEWLKRNSKGRDTKVIFAVRNARVLSLVLYHSLVPLTLCPGCGTCDGRAQTWCHWPCAWSRLSWLAIDSNSPAQALQTPHWTTPWNCTTMSWAPTAKRAPDWAIV